MSLFHPPRSLLLAAVFTGASSFAGSYEDVIRPLLAERCISCHSTEKQKGDLDLERFATPADIQKEPTVWLGVLEQIQTGEMPPKKEPQLSAEQKSTLTKWVQHTLDEIALANAGDPGPVVLRRLSNVEYGYTIQDLTGVPSLDPLKEFPLDGAAGEGFTNAGAALVMSPSLLTKYLDAAKDVASHAVLTPEGIHFSPSTSPRDWTDEALSKIRKFYAQFSESGGAMSVNLQGVKFDTNAGGRLPLAKYVAALQGKGDPAGLNKKYLATLRAALEDPKSSLLLDPLRARYRAGTLSAADIEIWQQALWRFSTVGHIGKVDGPKAWQEPVTPLAAEREVRVKLAAPKDGGDVTLYLAAGDAGDGSENDEAVWANARFIAPGREPLLLRDVRSVANRLAQHREQVIESVTRSLAAADEAASATDRIDVTKLAQKHEVDPGIMGGWLDYLGIGSSSEVKLGPLIGSKSDGISNYNFIKGWVGDDALSVLSNSSDATVRIPGTMVPHSVATHPSPALASVIAWRSPVAGTVRVSGSVKQAHPECGNGVAWSLEVRRGKTREVLASGVSQGGALVPLGPFENVRVFNGDAVALVIGPRDGNHSCDLTTVNLTLHDGKAEWDLAKDVSPDILAGNPHADGHGNQAVWHFCSQPATMEVPSAIPDGSVLARWRKSSDTAVRQRLAEEVQALLRSDLATVPVNSPNWALHRELLSFKGPLLGTALKTGQAEENDHDATSSYGLDLARFAGVDLKTAAPSVIEVRVPGSLVDGAEFVVTSKLRSPEGSVQMQVLTAKPAGATGIAPSKAESAPAASQWFENNRQTQHTAPVIVNEGSAARRRFQAAFDEFRALFPIALCYTKIVPVDEVVTLTLFYREDDQLMRLMLDDDQRTQLNRLWNELEFVSESPLKLVDVFEQLYQYATQDASPSAFEPLREPIKRSAESFRKRVVEAEPGQVQAVVDFAALAWRRPLNTTEQDDLRTLYEKLRRQELPHAAAVRMMMARVLVAPAYLYRGEKPAPGPKAAPVNDWELATRLSYFLWSSAPDAELRSLAAEGKLRGSLVPQMRRMMRDARVRRLATEFGCQWLHVRDLATLDEKSERHFPAFAGLRADMQEEAVLFFADLFQGDRSVMSLLDADHSFINGALARHYGIEITGKDWQRVDGLRARGRGGILGFASTLAKQSGASRTSAILRGNWLCEVVLGQKLPRPPKNVPVLPEEAPAGLTERQLTERHSSDPSCMACHQSIDPFGFALEGFDAIGRARTTDVAGAPIDSRAKLPDGTEFEGLAGLRSYVVTKRGDDFLRQFNRKLLGYALGRSVQLSDKPLLDEMLAKLKANDHKVSVAIELIITSPQFQEVRGKDLLTRN